MQQLSIGMNAYPTLLTHFLHFNI